MFVKSVSGDDYKAKEEWNSYKTHRRVEAQIYSHEICNNNILEKF